MFLDSHFLTPRGKGKFKFQTSGLGCVLVYIEFFRLCHSQHELFDRVKGFAIATGIDLADGYYQMRIDRRDTHKLGFM